MNMTLPSVTENKQLPAGTPLDDSKKSSLLFSPITIKSITAHNKIVVASMCLFSAEDGYVNDLYLVHIGSLALKGAGTVIIESTAVESRGRVSPHDLGLWKDDHMPGLKRLVDFIKAQGSVPGIQLNHGGRKASMGSPFTDYRLIPESEGGRSQDVVGPSDLPVDGQHALPRPLTIDEMMQIKQNWADAARRADQAGIEVLQIHSAHGFLLHSFLSGNANQRKDRYGGSLENRLRYPLEVIKAVRDVWPAEKPFWVRLSATDFKHEGLFAKDDDGWDVYQSIEYAKALKKIGVDVVDCSSGGLLPGVQYPTGPMWQVPFSDIIKREAGVATGAVGMITKGYECESILQENKADFVCVGREFLRDSGFALTAAKNLDVSVKWPNQFTRACQ